jgi:Putative bacterial sensory transduction regulator
VFARRSKDGAGLVSAAVETARDAAARLGDRRGATVPANAVVPDTATLQQILDEYSLVHSLDDDGDLVVRWPTHSVYFFHYGERGEVLQARLYLDARFDVDIRPALTVLLDDWNRTKLFPKAYTVLPDDGMVAVCAEHVFDFEAGLTRAGLKYTVGTWIHSLLQFADWIAEQA